VRTTLAKITRCKLLNSHDWKPIRVDGEQAWECRLCGERYSGPQPPKASPPYGF
jgi:hypothetical protein